MSEGTEQPQLEPVIIEKGGHISANIPANAMGAFPKVLTKPAMRTPPAAPAPAPQPAPAPAPAPSSESE